MNLPNKLTLLRMLLVPVFVVFLLWESCPHRFFIALVIFSIASITDLLDGKIARKYNLVTDFGKFMDPIADKLLVCAAFAAFVELGICSSWVLILVLAREFAVSSMRMIAAGSGKVVAANYWGKVKTASQMAVLIFVMLLQEVMELGWLASVNPTILLVVQNVAIWVTVVLTVISGVVYLGQNKKFLDYRK